MRYFACFMLWALTSYAFARNFYFSGNSGDDARSTAQAQNPHTPWKTLSKLSAFMGELRPGDSVLFRRGEVFDGSIEVTVSGLPGHDIVFSAYGSGRKPVINGLTTLKDWKTIGKNLWSAACSTCNNAVNMVVIDGKQRAMGRYPNADAANGGYLTFTSHNGNTQISDDALANGPNWKGAEVVIRVNRWIIDHDLITEHNGNTLTFLPGSTEKITDKGYFIQNHLGTLDKDCEWFYDPEKRALDVFFDGKPNGRAVEVSTVPTLVSVRNQANVVLSDLCIKGASNKGLEILNSRGIKVSNCELLFSGTDALAVSNGDHILISNNRIANTNNNAVSMYCSNTLVADNVVLDCAIIPGMGRSGNNTYSGMVVVGRNNTILHNHIDSIGYIPLRADGDSLLVKNNLINHFALIKDDAGGIYMYTGAGKKPFVNRRIEGNIVLNGEGAPNGTTYPDARLANGIYMDDNTQNVEIVDNTVANCGMAGIFIHNSSGIILQGNTSFNNLRQLTIEHEDITCANCEMQNNHMSRNVLASKAPTQQVVSFRSFKTDAGKLISADSNYYSIGASKNDYILVRNGAESKSCTLAGWRAGSGNDLSSTEKLTKPADDIRFEYNPEKTAKTIKLDGKYYDMRSQTQQDKITLSPFTSAVLIRER